jgi:hypothetical protein
MKRLALLVSVAVLLLGGGVSGCATDDQTSDGQASPSPSVTTSSAVSPTAPASSAPPGGATTRYTSPKGVTIFLDDFAPGRTITSPVTITGQVPGDWSFEASFPVVLVDWDGRIIAQEPAQLQGDWMTEELVPFTVTLTFKAPSYKNTGALILRKDNPSGLPKFDDALEIPVVFG